MRFFPWVDFQYMAVALFLGVVAGILAYLAWGAQPAAGKKAAAEKQGKEHGHNPVPSVLIFVYTVFAVWAVSYVIYVYLTGYRF
jgi:hypothetical protein